MFVFEVRELRIERMGVKKEEGGDGRGVSLIRLQKAEGLMGWGGGGGLSDKAYRRM